VSDPQLRRGRPGDLQAVFELGGEARAQSRRQRGLVGEHDARGEAETAEEWRLERPLVEFLVSQPDSQFWVAEDEGELVAYTMVASFEGMDELVELWVRPSHARRGLSRALLGSAWPDSPNPERGRATVAIGTPADLTLLTEFGVMPVSGEWQLVLETERYLEQRAQEVDSTEPAVHALTPDRAVEEWMRLEPGALGHKRPQVHEFFSRTRNCLAVVDEASGRATALCWVSSEGELIGPAVGETAEGVVPVVLAALDRVAKTQEPDHVGVFCTTAAWWLMDRLRRLGFTVVWPAWIMSSVPLPGLDRYVPTRPVRLL
jgi:hypothetical protein